MKVQQSPHYLGRPSKHSKSQRVKHPLSLEGKEHRDPGAFASNPPAKQEGPHQIIQVWNSP